MGNKECSQIEKAKAHTVPDEEGRAFIPSSLEPGTVEELYKLGHVWECALHQVGQMCLDADPFAVFLQGPDFLSVLRQFGRVISESIEAGHLVIEESTLELVQDFVSKADAGEVEGFDPYEVNVQRALDELEEDRNAIEGVDPFLDDLFNEA